jgi:ERCC4-type nuclease
MVHLDILRDNREQKGWEFDNFDATLHDETINTGDYTLAQLCGHDPDNDTYFPRFSVERKSGPDLVQSITRERERFQAEVKRALDWDSELVVMIEEPRRLFKRQEGFMTHNNITWPQINGTIESWEEHYNVSFEYAGSRGRAQKLTFDRLATELRAHLVRDEWS